MLVKVETKQNHETQNRYTDRFETLIGVRFWLIKISIVGSANVSVKFLEVYDRTWK